MSGDKACWRVVAGVELQSRSWGDETVAYHVGSGDTHLMNSAAVSALRILQDTPANIAQLVEAVCARTGQVPDDDFFHSMEAVIDQLAALKLIERGSP